MRTFMKSKSVVMLVSAVMVVGCGGDDFQAPLFEDPGQDAAKDVADAGHGDAAPEADADQGHDAQPEAGDDAAPEAGPDVCIPGTCESLGKNCGPTPDGCGSTLACGTCPANQSCGGGGEPNVCGGCVPDTCVAHNYQCGTMPDGCGNTITCGPPATNAGPGDACNAVGMPETWKCGSYQPFPMPKPGCLLQVSVYEKHDRVYRRAVVWRNL